MNSTVKAGMNPGAAPLKVVIIDDAVAIRRYLRLSIEEIPGVRVAGEAGTVADAVASLEELRPDVITLDIRLPDGCGLEVLKAIRDKKSACKVIVLTNYPYEQYRKACREGGADHFLDKSREFDKVPEILAKLTH